VFADNGLSVDSVTSPFSVVAAGQVAVPLEITVKNGAAILLRPSELRKSLGSFRGSAPQSDDLTIVAMSALPAGMKRPAIGRIEQPAHLSCGSKPDTRLV
jgi:hypothetical protein